MRSHCDVLVVGGGPAGATLAALADSRGADVMVIERARFPRDKVCGEFLSAEGCGVVERLGLLDELLGRGCVRIGACRITGRRGGQLDADLPDLGRFGREGLGVSRALLDPLLLDLARDRGARVRQRKTVLARHRTLDIDARRGNDDPAASLRFPAGVDQHVGWSRGESPVSVPARKGELPLRVALDGLVLLSLEEQPAARHGPAAGIEDPSRVGDRVG